ncbi:MAG: phosphate-starvation-inducible PsiE family protein [Woeseiaceae bacterium]|nr:phosphate-starvation-inducible PsiE family protein [Woeseiaceae bacterium]
MIDTTTQVHSGARRHGIRVVRLAEDVGLTLILLSTLVAGSIEVHHMWVQRNVMLEDLLLMFIYVETMTMVKVYWESGKLPVRMPLYIAIVAVARYLIIDIKDMDSWRALAIGSAILLLAVSVTIVRWGHVKLQYPRSLATENDTE